MPMREHPIATICSNSRPASSTRRRARSRRSRAPRFWRWWTRALGVAGASSQRLRDIVLGVQGTTYVTGHGARNYLDHALLEQAGIEVAYMAYELRSFPQLHGPFTPFVSALDLVANCGSEGRNVIASGTVGWRAFLSTQAPDGAPDRAVAAG